MKRNNFLSILLKIMGGITLLVFIFFAYLIFTINRDIDINRVESYAPIAPTFIYDINGNQIDVINTESREPISIKDVPPHVQNAFLAIEDRKFRSHHGFDFMRLGKAIFNNVTRTGRDGGSSITQQLAKNAFLSPERTPIRKLKEAILAIELERKYTKDEILENYLNTIYFGQSAYGIKKAAFVYFNKEPKDLTIGQAAILASLPKSPKKYSQIEHALPRQKTVLEQMHKFNFITDEEYEKAKNEKITFSNNVKVVEKKNKETNTSVAPEFTTLVLDEVEKILNIDDNDENQKALLDGYKIYATMDLDMQRAAYKAFSSNYNLKRNSKLNGALISIDSTNGFVKAMIGGKNYKKGDFNRAINAVRQPGSSFKPFIYLAALQAGIPMNASIEDSPLRIHNWSPKNYDGKFRDSMSLLYALEISNNIVPVKLLSRVGVDKVEKIWRDAGIQGGDFPKDLTLALGSITTRPLDMALAYAALSNGGYRVKPIFIYKIENKYGEVIYESKVEKKKIYDTKDVALLTYMLQNAINYGTGQPAKVFKDGNLIPSAGKTGTTSNYVSAWFTGYTPNLATVVYVGNDDNKPMSYGMTGGAAAAPIWKTYMQSVVNIENYNIGTFEFIDDYLKRNELTLRDIDLKVGLLDTDNVNKRPALFKTGTEPVENEKKFKNGLPF